MNFFPRCPENAELIKEADLLSIICNDRLQTIKLKRIAL